LLAGILDNSTGGVNGTFLSLAAPQLATSDLPNVVLDALANSSTSNTPIFGPPTSRQVVQHQNSCSGFLGCAAQAWNSLAGDVVSGFATIATLAWSVTIAPVVYLANMVAAGAKLLDEYVIQPTAFALSTVGKAIVNALNALLDYIIQSAEATLGRALAPLISEIDTFGLSIADSLAGAVSNVAAGKAVTQADAAAFWDNLTGPLFLTGIALAVAAEIVIAVLTPFTFGATFLVGLIISLLLSAALQALDTKSVAHSSGPTGITAFNSAAIRSCEAVANSSNSPPREEANWTTNWNALVGTADRTTTLLGTQLGLGLPAAAYYGGNGLVLPAVSFGFGLVGIALSVAGASTGSRLVQETNVGISFTSAALDTVDLTLFPEDRVGPLGTLNGVTLAMDSVSAGIGLAEFVYDG